MRPYFLMVLTIGFVSGVYGAEMPAEPSKEAASTVSAPAKSETAHDAAKSPAAKPAEPAKASASESDVKVEAPVTEKKSEPVVETTKAEAPVTKAADAAARPSAPFVVPLQDLITYHEKEIVSLKTMMASWDKKAASTLQRKNALKDELKTKTESISQLNKEATKASKREASRLSKEIPRIHKDISAADKELKALTKDLYAELKESSRDTQQSMISAYQQTGQKIQRTAK